MYYFITTSPPSLPPSLYKPIHWTQTQPSVPPPTPIAPHEIIHLYSSLKPETIASHLLTSTPPYLLPLTTPTNVEINDKEKERRAEIKLHQYNEESLINDGWRVEWDRETN